jgi:hypothetical protein
MPNNLQVKGEDWIAANERNKDALKPRRIPLVILKPAEIASDKGRESTSQSRPLSGDLLVAYLNRGLGRSHVGLGLRPPCK